MRNLKRSLFISAYFFILVSLVGCTSSRLVLVDQNDIVMRGPSGASEHYHFVAIATHVVVLPAPERYYFFLCKAVPRDAAHRSAMIKAAPTALRIDDGTPDSVFKVVERLTASRSLDETRWIVSTDPLVVAFSALERDPAADGRLFYGADFSGKDRIVLGYSQRLVTENDMDTKIHSVMTFDWLHTVPDTSLSRPIESMIEGTTLRDVINRGAGIHDRKERETGT